MSSAESPDVAGLSIARAKGFAECLTALRRALTTTPVGWMLAVWFCWAHVPLHSILSWLGPASLAWAGGMLVLQRMISTGATLERHRHQLHWVAGLDGFGWGLLTWFLIGYDPVLNAVLMALLCGVTSINAQVYGTYVKAYYWQIATLCAVAVLGLLHDSVTLDTIDYAAGLTVFIGLTGYYTRAIARRLIEGIRLQHANASLAAQLGAALQKVELDAATDALTGHWNRRALDDMLKRQVALDRAGRQSFSILMLDIDFFKNINDEFGHIVGDDVLRAFAQRLREFLRTGDFCARFGGEEFVIVLPETPLATALEVAERIRKGVAQRPLLTAPRLQVTVSIGAAAMTRQQSIGDLFAAADAAVYLAKHGGRDQVRASPPMPALVDAA